MGVSDVGTDLNGVTVNFRLDQTNTSIIMDNGSAFGVNTIKAVTGMQMAQFLFMLLAQVFLKTLMSLMTTNILKVLLQPLSRSTVLLSLAD